MLRKSGFVNRPPRLRNYKNETNLLRFVVCPSMAKFPSANGKRIGNTTSFFSELEIEAAQQLIQLCKDLQYKNRFTKASKADQNAGKRDVEDEDYAPSDELLTTAKDEEMVTNLRKRRFRFRTVDSIYSLTEPLVMVSGRKKNKYMT